MISSHFLKQSLLVCGVGMALTSCQMMSKWTQKVDTNPDVALRNSWDAELREYEKELEDEKWVEAAQGFHKFTEQNGLNIDTNRAKIGEARALIGQNDFQGGLLLLQDVLASALTLPELKNQESFLALAAFESGLAYEGLGDETKSLAAYQDAEKRQASLPPEIARAELPARLAVATRRVQGGAPSKQYFQQAQAGVEALFRGDDEKNKTYRARTYQQMGQMSNLTAIADKERDPRGDIMALEYMQFFSLRAIEENDGHWSAKALEDLQHSYQDIWNLVMSKRKNDDDPLVNLTVAIEKLRGLQSPESANAQTQQLFQFLDVLEAQAQVLLADTQDMTPLTPEAQKREGLRREGIVRDDPRFKIEIKKSKKKKPEAHPEIPAGPLNLPEKKAPVQLTPQDPNIDHPAEGH